MLNAQTTPSLVDPNLRVQTIVGNLNQPTSTAFLGPNDFFVLEKATGEVKRVVNEVVEHDITVTVLDTADIAAYGSAGGAVKALLKVDVVNRSIRSG